MLNKDIWLQQREKEDTRNWRAFCCTAFKASSLWPWANALRRINGGPLRYQCSQLLIIPFLPPLLSPAPEGGQPAAYLHPKFSSMEPKSWALSADEGRFKFHFPPSFWKSWGLYTRFISPVLLWRQKTLAEAKSRQFLQSCQKELTNIFFLLVAKWGWLLPTAVRPPVEYHKYHRAWPGALLASCCLDTIHCMLLAKTRAPRSSCRTAGP